MLILYYILGLLLFLFLLTLLPVRAVIHFHESFVLELRYLFLRIPIIPGDEQPLEEEEEEESGEDESSPAKRVKSTLSKKGLSGFLQGFTELLRLLQKAAGGILKRLRLRRFDLYLCLAGKNDPAGSAVRYGQVAGGIYAACGGLFCLLPCRRKGVSVDLNYTAEKAVINFTAELSIVPLFAIKEAVVFLIRGLFYLKKWSGKSQGPDQEHSDRNPKKRKEVQHE